MKRPYYLATTGNSDIWDLDTGILALGPWCLTGEKCRRIFEGKNIEYALAPSPWKPASKIKEAADYCYGLYAELMPYLSKNLNSAHNVEYPDKYWQVLVGPWLLQFIGIFYDRYKRIEQAMEMFPEAYSSVLPESQTHIDTFDTLHLMERQVYDDFFNLKLFSIILRELFPGRIKEIGASFRHTECEPQTVRYGIKEKLLNAILKKIAPGYKDKIVLLDMYHLSAFDKALLMLKSNVSVVSYFYPNLKKEQILNKRRGYGMRERFKMPSDIDRFEKLLCRVIPDAIPAAFIENYLLYRTDAANPRGCKIIGSAVGWYYNEFFKCFAAEESAKGTRLIDFQHGAVYGMSLAAPCETISSEKDAFYTWGWTLSGNPKMKPLPSPRLSKLKNTHAQKNDKLLFIGTIEYKYVSRFHSVAFPEDMPEYFEKKGVLLRCLSEEARRHVLYKPFFNDYGWGCEKGIVADACPGAEFINKGMAHKLMQKAKFVVVDSPSTPFLEALTINVPSVFYWDHEVFLMRQESEKYFDLLRKAGILHKDPESAAKKINQVFGDPMRWWLSKEVQDARAEFCGRFGYARKDWLSVWIDEFKNLENMNGAKVNAV